MEGVADVQHARVEERHVHAIDLRTQLRQRRRWRLSRHEEGGVGKQLVEVDHQHAFLPRAGDHLGDISGDEAGTHPALARHERDDLGGMRAGFQALGFEAHECVAERAALQWPVEHVAKAGAHRGDQGFRRGIGREQNACEMLVLLTQLRHHRQLCVLHRRRIDDQYIEGIETVATLNQQRRTVCGASGAVVAAFA